MKYLTDKYILLPFVEKTDFLYTKYNITPNQITITNGLIITNFFLYFILNGNYCISSIFLFLRLLLDGSDGYIARKYKLYSKEGDIYDHISDSIFMGQLFMIFVYKLYFKGDLLEFISFSEMSIFIQHKINTGTIKMAASVKLQPLITIIGRLILLALNKVICEQALKIPAPKPINKLQRHCMPSL